MLVYFLIFNFYVVSNFGIKLADVVIVSECMFKTASYFHLGGIYSANVPCAKDAPINRISWVNNYLTVIILKTICIFQIILLIISLGSETRPCKVC